MVEEVTGMVGVVICSSKVGEESEPVVEVICSSRVVVVMEMVVVGIYNNMEVGVKVKEVVVIYSNRVVVVMKMVVVEIYNSMEVGGMVKEVVVIYRYMLVEGVIYKDKVGVVETCKYRLVEVVEVTCICKREVGVEGTCSSKELEWACASHTPYKGS
jgi:hypothetical protein